MSVEIEFIFHPVPAALTTWEVNIEQTESTLHLRYSMQRGNDTAFYIEERGIHAEAQFQRGTFQKSRYATVAQFFSGIPNDIIARKTPLLLFELVGANLDLLQTQDIGLLLPCPSQGVLT